MSLYGFNQGFIQPAIKLLVGAATSNDILVVPATDQDYQITDIFVANNDGSARTVLLRKFDGTTHYILLPTKSVPANDFVHLTFPFPLARGWTLRGTCSADSVVTVHVTYVKTLNK